MGDDTAPSPRPSVLVAVVAFEAEAFIQELLERIPDRIDGADLTVLVADDASRDATLDRARAWAASHPDLALRLVARPTNLGYGGNQKACYAWAAEQGFDYVVLLHGDAQYPPEQIGDLVAPLLADPGIAVFGSRMTEPSRARAGGMPIDRFVGNRVISRALNRLTGSELSEWFSGFRAYRVQMLTDASIGDLPPGFDFDTAVTMRLLDRGHRIVEVPIPTRYADEISRVPLIRTGLAGLVHGVRFRRAHPRRQARPARRPGPATP